MKRIDTDAVFGGTFPLAMGGTVAFGKLAANALSLAAVVLSMAAIFAFLVGEGFGRLGALTCCLAMAMTEPFVAMANQSKYEYITFLLAVCALLLAARPQLVAAGLISVLAIQVQPIGIMAPVCLVAYELSRVIQTRGCRVEFDRIAKLALAGALAVGVYFILHPGILALLATSHAAEWNAYAGNFLYGYFFEGRLHRHVPEFVVFAVCLLVHTWRRDYVRWPFPLVASLATLLTGFLLNHANGYYVPFWYFPSFVLLFLTVSRAWRAVALPALVLMLFVPQFAVAYVEAHKYADQRGLEMARSIIAARGADLNQAHIFGDFIVWPVFTDLSFEWAPTGKFNQAPDTA